jgi:hypothetical protein
MVQAVTGPPLTPKAWLRYWTSKFVVRKVALGQFFPPNTSFGKINKDVISLSAVVTALRKIILLK